ncbi:MAG: helix-turn-helix domain-containing protein [Alphaproteobacteria bacterium]
MNDRGGPLRTVSRIRQQQAELARQMVALAFGIPAGELTAATRRRAPVAFARQVAMYLTHVAWSMPLVHVGAAFGRDRTTASHACRLVEDRRDDPRLDGLLTALEQGLRQVPCRPDGAAEGTAGGTGGAANGAAALHAG